MEPQFSSQAGRGKARAKINLTLHVGRAIADGRYKGYHPLDSLVVFADIGDQLSYVPNEEALSLSLAGPFGEGLKTEDDNLILSAARAFFIHNNITPCGHFHLEKNLPLASGIGGGSADAAAALRLLQAEFGADDATMMILSEQIGADVPVCFCSQTSHMRGIGQELEAKPDMGALYALLVNPGFAVSTPSIFKTFDNGESDSVPQPQDWSPSLLLTAQRGRNDLQAIAIGLRPEIERLLELLSDLPHCQLARMSGSGATCFALFETQKQAAAAHEIMRSQCPDYWCVQTMLGDPL